ncbi:MAG: hypothetical protein ACKVOE_04375 [Rickettsiales bacterium]
MQRRLIRILHVAAAVYNVLFVYTSLHTWAYGFMLVQYVSLPLLMLTGALMVHGRKKAAGQRWQVLHR